MTCDIDSAIDDYVNNQMIISHDQIDQFLPEIKMTSAPEKVEATVEVQNENEAPKSVEATSMYNRAKQSDETSGRVES